MQDQYYNYNFNKVLESLSRDAFLSSELKNKAAQAQSGGPKADTLTAINLLASHTDAFEGFSSFGRTVVKAYTMMSTVMKPPTATVKTGELWVSLGERTPIPHSTFVGFKVDFDAMTMTPIGTQKTTNWKHLPHYDRSLELYTNARSQYVLGSPEEKSRSIALLDEAIHEAEEDASIQQSDRPTQLLPYWFVRARVQHDVGFFDDAMASWDELLQADRFALLHDFGKALVEAYSVATSDKLPAGHPKKLDAQARDARLASALARMQSFLGQVRPGNRFDLQNKIDLGKKLQKGEDVTLPDIDFVVVYN